jgi:hypothetical protein
MGTGCGSAYGAAVVKWDIDFNAQKYEDVLNNEVLCSFSSLPSAQTQSFNETEADILPM